MTYYRCHRGGSKERPHKIGSDVKSIDPKESRRDRTFRLYDCEFQIKVLEPHMSKCSSNLIYITIYIHSKYSDYNPKSNADIFSAGSPSRT